MTTKHKVLRAGTSTMLAIMPAFFFMSSTVLALETVENGDTRDIDSNDPATDWLVRDNSTLNITGGTTLSVRVISGSTLNINDATITANPGSAGITINSSQAMLNNARVTSDTYGLMVNRPNSSTQGSTVTATGGYFQGGDAGAVVTALSTLELSNTEITGTDVDSVGLIVAGGSVLATANTRISGDAAGVRMESDPANIGDHTLVLDNSSVKGLSGSAIVVDTGIDATIEVLNNSTLIGGNGNVLEVEGASTANMRVANSALQGNVQVTDNSTVNLAFDRGSMEGDIVREDGSTANVTLNNRSSFTGRLNNSNLTLNSQSSLTMVDNDRIDKLSMNDGIVNFGAPGEVRGSRQLEVGTLEGSGGIIAMQGNFQTGESDLLKAQTATGSYQLAVNASGKDAASPQPLTLVQIDTNHAAFALLGGKVDVGTWEYDLAERVNAAGETEFYLNPTTRLTSGAHSVVALFKTALTVSYGETKSLEYRMSELHANDRLHGLWVRPYGNKYNVADGSSGVGYRQRQQGFSMGADTRLGDSRWRLGVLAGYSQSDLDLNGGTSAKVDSFYVGPYFGWLNPDNGNYVDGALKFNHFRNDATVSMSDGKRAKGDYSNSGVSAMVEVGRHINLGNEWFAKPSAQVSAAVIQGKNYRLDNDMEADGDRTHSLRTKLGITAGRNIDFDRDTRVRPYGSVAVVHEFASNDDNVRVNGNPINTNLSGSGLEFGAGVTVSLSERMHLDAGVDYFKGKNIEQPVAIKLGWSFQW